ncbi:MBL fold metallo-hydrolase [Baaleninema simplex]|uniref:MBL fold metallo-hydrolase n=1 Tax=Baaleninema simplex TaxID=2862350 RepID=UPI000348E2F3|nr:MBL fold metallo-hydrolase [Baaleninema simplex]
MKRRELIRYLQLGAIATATTGWWGSKSPSVAQSAASLEIEYLGHTCFRFTGSDRRILANPFRTLGCTAGYPEPNIDDADLVLVSSFLLDEGAVDTVPESKLLFESGIFEVQGMTFEGIPIPHDRIGGNRFGTNVIWTWQQGGLKIAHLGGAAAPIDVEQRILIGRPDIALIPVGGSEKAYTAEEAKQAVSVLNPRLVIPTHYRTAAADDNACDIEPLENFLNLMEGTEIRVAESNRIALNASDLPQRDTVIRVLTPPINTPFSQSQADAAPVRPTPQRPSRKTK